VTQFHVYANVSSETQERFPLLLDVQTDLLEYLGTRVVIPMAPANPIIRRIALQTLTPICSLGGRDYLLVTPQLVNVSEQAMGPVVGDLVTDRAAILGALDFLINGF
jgi:toxin CcdB